MRLRHAGTPHERIVIARLVSYGAALQRLPELVGVEHLRNAPAARRNDPATVALTHPPTRPENAGLPIHLFGAALSLPLQLRLQLFRPRRHLLCATEHRSMVGVCFQPWSEITRVLCACAAGVSPARARSSFDLLWRWPM